MAAYAKCSIRRAAAFSAARELRSFAVLSTDASRRSPAVGMRARVEDVLRRLAWEMYSERLTSLPGTDLFNLLMSLRGNRDYSLVDFRTQLINPCRMMAAGDEDGLRFAYPGFRSYCCALYLYRQTPESATVSSKRSPPTSGRRSRAQLWEEVLLILAGLWNDTGSLAAHDPVGRGAQRRRPALYRGAMFAGSEAGICHGLV